MSTTSTLVASHSQSMKFAGQIASFVRSIVNVRTSPGWASPLESASVTVFVELAKSGWVGTTQVSSFAV